MLGFAHDTAALRKVRLRSAERDGLRARQRLDRRLARVDWHLPGLAPAAILLVKRLAPAAQPRQHDRDVFGAVVRDELMRCLERARRPWLHDDAEHADAVLFLDEHELAACMIRNWVRGRSSGAWWVRVALGDLSLSDWLRRHVITRGEVFTATTERLVQCSAAESWYRQLETGDVSLARTAIERAYGVSFSAPGPVVTEDAPLPSGRPGQPDGLTEANLVYAARRNLLAVAPEVAHARLSAERRQLFAASLAVRRRLSWARSTEFSRTCTGLSAREAPGPEIASEQTPMPRADSPRLPEMPVPPASGSADTAQGSDARAVLELPHDHAPSSMQPQVTREAQSTPGTSEAGIAPPAQASAVKALEPSTAGSRDAQESDITRAEAVEPRPARVEADAQDEIASDTQRPQPAVAEPALEFTPARLPVTTRFGGIFYLLNVALALGLYGDFTMPRYRGIDLSPWDWLAAIGRRWFGNAFRKDQVWKLLAQLAGHPPRLRPERGFEPPDKQDLQRWFQEQLTYLNTRIGRAIGADDPRQVPDRVCRHRAHIYMSASEVDVHLSLDDLPIELRAAGMDRDPGWIPAAGRSVRFHFQ